MFSASLLKHDRFRNASYYGQPIVNRVIDTPLFVNLDVVDSEFYEAKSLKKHHFQSSPSGGSVCQFFWKN